MNEEKKWYVYLRCAEGDALFFVRLTDAEVKIVEDFLKCQRNGPDTGYSGSIRLKAGPFDTKQEAIRYSKQECDYIFAYDYRNEEYDEDES